MRGISLEDGLTEYNLKDALLKKPLTQKAQQRIVVADSSKIGCTTFTYVVPLSTVADTASRSSVGRCATGPIEPIQFLSSSAKLGESSTTPSQRAAKEEHRGRRGIPGGDLAAVAVSAG